MHKIKDSVPQQQVLSFSLASFANRDLRNLTHAVKVITGAIGREKKRGTETKREKPREMERGKMKKNKRERERMRMEMNE